MSYRRKRGNKIHLYWKVKVWDEEKKAFVWKQRSKSVTTEPAEFKEFKENFDYKHRRNKLGLTNFRITWPEFEAEFLPTRKGKTREIYTLTFRRFVLLAKPRRIAEFTYEHAKAWRARLDEHFWIKKKGGQEIQTPLSPTTKNMDLRNMQAAWAEAVRSKYAEENVFMKLDDFPETKRKRRYMVKTDVQKVIDQAESEKADNPALHVMCVVLKYTGVRKGELINLTWASFDLDRGVMFILGTENWEPKDREEAAIGLHDKALAALKEWRAHLEGSYGAGNVPKWVFPGQNGGRRTPRALHQLFVRLYRRAGVTASGLHVWRHSFGTHMPIPDKLKQKMFRHSDPKTTQGYNDVTPEEMAQVKEADY